MLLELAGGAGGFCADPNLLVGAETADDAAVYRLSDELACVLTTDFFTPIVDDPYDFGRIAAANALSDVYAMGAEPRVCLNLMAFPRELGLEVAGAVLHGGADTVAAAGALVAGGHTIEDAEPKFGLCVMGVVHPRRLLHNGGARPGDALFLTKPLGTGIYTRALRTGRTDDAGMGEAVESMAALNAAAGRVVREHAAGGFVHACTDVTGFGLVGHAHEMCAASACGLAVEFGALPLLGRAREWAAANVVPGKLRAIRSWAEAFAVVESGGDRELERLAWNIVADPQTSGGLLVAVDPGDAAAFEEDLRLVGAPAAARIGAFTEGPSVVRVNCV